MNGLKPASRRKTSFSHEAPWWMAVPALALFGMFALLPLVGVVVLSLTSWDGLGDPTWTGADNWQRIVESPVTRNALWLSVLMVVFSWLIQAPLSLALGIFMAGRTRFREVLSVLFFLPLLFSAAAIAITFKALLDPSFGAGSATGIAFLSQNWLGNPDLAFAVVILVISWSFVPFHSLLYQAGVRQIPTSLYEAARLDGAGSWKMLRHITIPQLRYTIVTSSTLMLVGSLTYFDLVYVLTQGGPGIATRILPLDMYLTGFRSFDMGGASVIAVILVALGMGISFALSRVTRSNRMESQQEGL